MNDPAASPTFPAFATADLCDAYPELISVLELPWRSIGRHRRFCGPARTIQAFEDNSRVREAVGTPGSGAVLVVDAGGSMRRAMLGDRLAGLAVEHGWAGVIMAGCIRDVAIIDGLALGVRCLGTHPRKTDKRGQGLAEIEVVIGGARVGPGDWIYADEDGVIVAPRPLHIEAED